MFTGLGLGVAASSHKFAGAGVQFLDAVSTKDSDDGRDGYVTTNITTNNLTAGKQFTLGLWVKYIRNFNFNDFFRFGEDTSADQFIDIDTGSGGNDFRLRVQETTSKRLIIGMNTNIRDDNWHHVLFVSDLTASGSKVYLDGVEDTKIIRNDGPFNNQPFNNYSELSFGFFSTGLAPGLQSEFTQFWFKTSYEDSPSLFYNSGARDLGADGTATGLPTPDFYHVGDTTDFATVKGNTSALNYTLSEQGGVLDSDQGPQLG